MRLLSIFAAVALLCGGVATTAHELTFADQHTHLHEAGRDLLRKSSGGCDVPLTTVTNQLTKGGIDCSACLSRTAKKERQTCDPRCAKGLQRGVEFFYPPPQAPVVKSCKTAEDCYKGNSSLPCDCCGKNLGYDYTIKRAQPGSPYYAQYGELASYRMNCADPAITECQTCLLWRKLRGIDPTITCTPTNTKYGQCFSTIDGEHTYMATNVVDDPGHYLLLPGSKTSDWPVIGIEDPQVLNKKLEKIWDLAWGLAYNPYSNLAGNIAYGSMDNLIIANHTCQIGIGLNPGSARSMHQMHIHVSRIPDPVRKTFQGRRKNFGKWTRTTIPISNPNRSSEAYQWDPVIVYAKYFPLSGKRGPSKYQIFHQVYAFANFNFQQMSAFGVMLIPDEQGFPTGTPTTRTPKGFYLVISANNQWGGWNTMTPPNKGFQPENLLCNDWSTNDKGSDAGKQSGGNFWSPAECGRSAPGSAPGPASSLPWAR